MDLEPGVILGEREHPWRAIQEVKHVCADLWTFRTHHPVHHAHDATPGEHTLYDRTPPSIHISSYDNDRITPL